MYDFVDDFENYDLKTNLPLSDTQLNKSNKYEDTQFYIYIKEYDKFPYKFLLDKNKFNILTFLEIKKIMVSLKSNYYNIKNIDHQFNLDISRSHLYINKNKIIYPEKALNYIKYTYPKNYQDILILCTQSIFVPILEWLYQTLPDNYIIGELDINKRRKIILIINEKKLTIKKKLRIFTVYKGTDITIREINIKVIISDFTKLDKLQLEIEFI